jgi:hypothetical protein
MTLFKKKILTDVEAIEKEFMDKYNLTKDLSEPNRYWINNEIHINILMSIPKSREAAARVIEEYYMNPQLMAATEEQKKTKGTLKSGGMGSFLENAGKGAEKVFGPIGDNFMKNAPTATDNLSNMGMGSMRDGEANAQKLAMNDYDSGIKPLTTAEALAGFNLNVGNPAPPKNKGGRPPAKAKK